MEWRRAQKYFVNEFKQDEKYYSYPSLVNTIEKNEKEEENLVPNDIIATRRTWRRKRTIHVRRR